MRDLLLVACLLVLALIPSGPARAQSQVNTLLAVRLEPPIAGVRICWQNRCFETDTQGVWKHTITVVAGQWYELVVTEGEVAVQGVRGPSNVYVQLTSDKRIRFRFTSTPGATSGPLTIMVRHDIMPTETATVKPTLPAGPSATPTMTPTVGPSPTAGPTAMPTLQPE